MEYHDPNDYWKNNHDKFDDIDEDDMMAKGVGYCITYIVIYIIIIGLCLCFISVFFGCKSPEYVHVPEYHEVHHHHKDSVIRSDSIRTENTTIIREVDSAAMAKYGIQMLNNQRAWLVLQREIDKQMKMIAESHTDTVHERDSVPYPVKVTETVEVEQSLAWWQQALMWLGAVSIIILLIWVWMTK